jgi:hypothetical protein
MLSEIVNFVYGSPGGDVIPLSTDREDRCSDIREHNGVAVGDIAPLGKIIPKKEPRKIFRVHALG